MIKSKSCPDLFGGTAIPASPTVVAPKRTGTITTAYSPSFQFYSIANAPISSIITCEATLVPDYDVATCLATPVECQPDRPPIDVPFKWIQWYMKKKKNKSAPTLI